MAANERNAELIGQPDWKKALNAATSLVGLHIDEYGITAECVNPQGNGKAYPLSFGKGVLRYPWEWSGIDRLWVTPARLDFLCAPNMTTYRQALSTCLQEALEALRKENAWSNGAKIAFGADFPESVVWERYRDNWFAFLSGIFQSQKESLCAMFPLSIAACMEKNVKEECLFVSIGSEWSVWVWRNSDGSRKRRNSAFLMMPPDGALSARSVIMRLNDYERDSVSIWREARFPSWKEGFSHVCGTLRPAREAQIRTVCVLCERGYFSTLRNILKTSELVPKDARITHIDSPARIVVEWMYRNRIVKRASPKDNVFDI